ncbi:MAG: hypothetical protein ACOYEV_09015 [Candidatus Nanopelagicales bacterium]
MPAESPGDSVAPWPGGQAGGSLSEGGPQWEEPSVGRAPLGYLLLAAGGLAVAILLIVAAPHNPVAALAAWALAGPICIVSVGLFLGADTRRRSAAVYFGKPWSVVAYRVLAIGGVLVASGAGWLFADWAARR